MNVAIQREATVYDEPEVIARSAQELVGDLNPQQAEAFLRGAHVTLLAFCPDDTQTIDLAKA